MAKNRKRLFIGTFKLRNILTLCFASFFVFGLCIASFAKTEFVVSPKATFTIVVDAGHGGVDGGSVGKTTGVVESDLNLIYAKILKAKLIDYGFRVVMTREGRAGLYDESAPNLKRSDMKKRKEIIEKSNADLVLSIHMNSLPISKASGGQVFFDAGNEGGEKLATSIQSQLKLNLKNTTKQAKSGDYYIVRCTPIPACIIECGFLSNETEEKLLQQKSYQEDFCYAVVCGVIDYLGVEQTKNTL